MGQKFYYPIEDQVNDCYKYMGVPMKDAHNMTENELERAVLELKEHFEWVEHSECYQLVPKYIDSSKLIF